MLKSVFLLMTLLGFGLSHSLGLGEDTENNNEPCVDEDITIYGRTCDTPCAQNGQDYYWCRFSDGSWDYCSMDEMHTRYGKECAYACAKNGQSYYWCDETGDETGSWDYCSPRCKH